MPRSYNSITLIGHVGQEPEVNTTGTGKQVANFSVATSPPWKDDETNWHRITAWQKLAEIVEQYVHKGDPIFIVGRLRYDKWTDNEGRERVNAEIIADQINLLGGRTSNSTRRKAAAAKDEDVQLPF